MNKYIEIITEIEAIQWTGENLSEIFDNIPLTYKVDDIIKSGIFSNNFLKEARISDWIVKFPSGKYFVIPDNVFKESYQKI